MLSMSVMVCCALGVSDLKVLKLGSKQNMSSHPLRQFFYRGQSYLVCGRANRLLMLTTRLKFAPRQPPAKEKESEQE